MRTPEHAPHLPHIPLPDVRGILRWTGTHWAPVGISLAAAASGAYLAFAHDKGSDTAPVSSNVPASDTIKSPDQGPSIEVVTNPASESVTSGEPPKPEAKVEPFDNGLVSPKTYTKAEYITWDIPGGGKAEGIGINLEAGEEFRIPENMQVAAAELTRDSRPIGYRIVAARNDGSQIIILGDVIPVNITSVGKNLPASTVVGISGGSGLTLVGKYTQVLVLSAEDRNRLFPDQTKIPPKFIANTPQPQSTNQGQGITFFGVKPPAG